MPSLLWLVLLLSWPLYVSGKGECVLKDDDYHSVRNILRKECTKVTSEGHAKLKISLEHEENFKEWMKIVEHIDVKELWIKGGSLEKISFPKLRSLRIRNLSIKSNTELTNLEMEAIKILEATQIMIQSNDNLKSLKIKADEFHTNNLHIQENNELEELDFSGITKLQIKFSGIIKWNVALKSIKFADEIEQLQFGDLLEIQGNPKLTSIKLPLRIKAKKNECAPLYFNELSLFANRALNDIRFPADGFQKCSQNGEVIKNVKGEYSHITNSKNLRGEVINKIRRTFEITDFDDTRSCIPPNPLKKLDAINAGKPCNLLIGEIQLAKDATEDNKTCIFREIRGNLTMGKLEVDKFDCLKNVAVKGDISCARPDPVANWERLKNCTVIEGDLKLDGNISGNASSCSIAIIRGNLSLGVLKKDKLVCLKMTKVTGDILCVRSNLVTDWDNLSNCQVIEGDLQIAINITGNPSCSVSKIQGNLTLGGLEMKKVACLKNAVIKGQLSSTNCAFDYSLFPNAKSNAPLLDCQIPTTTVSPRSAEGQKGGDSNSQNDSGSKKSKTVVGIVISVVLIVLGIIGIVVFFVLRTKQSKKTGTKKEFVNEISQKSTDSSLSTGTSTQEKNGKKPELKKEEQQQKEEIKFSQQAKNKL